MYFKKYTESDSLGKTCMEGKLVCINIFSSFNQKEFLDALRRVSAKSWFE